MNRGLQQQTCLLSFGGYKQSSVRPLHIASVCIKAGGRSWGRGSSWGERIPRSFSMSLEPSLKGTYLQDVLIITWSLAPFQCHIYNTFDNPAIGLERARQPGKVR